MLSVVTRRPQPVRPEKFSKESPICDTIALVQLFAFRATVAWSRAFFRTLLRHRAARGVHGSHRRRLAVLRSGVRRRGSPT